MCANSWSPDHLYLLCFEYHHQGILEVIKLDFFCIKQNQNTCYNIVYGFHQLICVLYTNSDYCQSNEPLFSPCLLIISTPDFQNNSFVVHFYCDSVAYTSLPTRNFSNELYEFHYWKQNRVLLLLGNVEVEEDVTLAKAFVDLKQKFPPS